MIKEGLINNIEIRKDANPICLNNGTCINSYLMIISLNIKLDELFDTNNITEDKEVKINNTQSLYIKKYNSGILSYGLEDRKDPPEHNGLWSSNPETLYKYTGIETIDIILKEQYLVSSILLEDAKKLMPDGYKIVKFNIENNEVYNDSWFIVKEEDITKINKE